MKFGFVLVVSVIFLSCSSLSLFNWGNYNVHIRIKNSGKSDIYDAHVYFGKRRCVGGAIGPTGGSTHIFFAKKIPDEFIVKFTTELGKLVEKNIKRGILPKGKYNGITLEAWINGDDETVEVKYVPDYD